MILLDSDKTILAVNEAFIAIFHLIQQQIIGQQLEMIKGIHFDTENFEEIFDKNSSNRKKIVELKNNKGNAYKAEFILLDSTHSKSPYYLGVINKSESENALKQELENQKALKGSVKDKLEQESELSEMKSRFLSIASHEFRTPLAGILSSLNLIDRYIDADQRGWSNFKNNDKVVNHLNKINESVKNLTGILNTFLTLGNIEKGEIPVKYTRFNLQKTLKSQVSQFQEMSKPGQEINYQHIGKEKMVLLDKNLLRNIINNLLSNAIKFSPENTKIELLSEIDTNTIKLVVQDQGIGIPSRQQNKIFSRFFRAHNALNYEEGTGLGLNIVKKYIDLLKGNISFDSKQNMGTTFYISFPKNKS
ncbi:MAG: HAMP domain-containing histidine kinase [Bacteroidetes bacterium]|nr:HAMP domain-containing histidine kinase [Bacteroidota bacterium]MBU2556195.1 HAMP domain-containing histidine kinase [Bacteroidota bacterium]